MGRRRVVGGRRASRHENARTREDGGPDGCRHCLSMSESVRRAFSSSEWLAAQGRAHDMITARARRRPTLMALAALSGASLPCLNSDIQVSTAVPTSEIRNAAQSLRPLRGEAEVRRPHVPPPFHVLSGHNMIDSAPRPHAMSLTYACASTYLCPTPLSPLHFSNPAESF